jgi:hypothetical protein
MLTAVALLGLLATIPTTSASLAQNTYPVKIYPDNHGPLAIDTLYAIEVHCAQGPVPFPSTTLPGPLPSTSMKISHAVVVSTANVNGPAAIANLPASAVAVAVPYSVDTASASANQQTSLQSCDANYLIEGPASLYLTAIYSEASTTDPGTIADAFHSLVQVATSLAPVVTGGAIAANAAKTLKGVDGALPPLTKLFQDLFPSDARNYQRTQRLFVGSPSIATQFSTTTVTVRPLTSVVFDKGNPDRPYFKSLTKFIDGIKVNGPPDEKACGSLRFNLAQAGFKAPDDQAYALGRFALNNNAVSKAAVAECLGALCFVAIAQQMDDVLWNEASGLKPDGKTDCENVVPPVGQQPVPAQPPWASVGPIVKDLAILYGQYNSDAAPPATFAQFTDANVANPISIVDKTSYTLFGATTATDADSLFNLLKSKSFLRLGCWAGVDDPTMFYGARASIVSAKIAKVGATAPITDAIAMFPFWSDGKIAKIVVSDEASDITTAIGKLASCGGFTVQTK